MRPLALLFLWMGWAMITASPSLAYAETPDAYAAEFIATVYCDDTQTLGGLVEAESGAQPYRVRVAVAQIFKREADSRGLTVCALARFTNFSSVPSYVRAHPQSYQAHQFAYPSEGALQIARAVMLGELEDETGGMMHFDSHDGLHIEFSP